MLSGEGNFDPLQQIIVLTANIALGKREAAREIWDRYEYSTIDGLPLDLRLLGALLVRIN